MPTRTGAGCLLMLVLGAVGSACGLATTTNWTAAGRVRPGSPDTCGSVTLASMCPGKSREFTLTWSKFGFAIPADATVVAAEARIQLSLNSYCNKHNYANGIANRFSGATLVGFATGAPPANVSAASCCGTADGGAVEFDLPTSYSGTLSGIDTASESFAVTANVSECGCRPIGKGMAAGTLFVGCLELRLTYHIPTPSPVPPPSPSPTLQPTALPSPSPSIEPRVAQPIAAPSSEAALGTSLAAPAASDGAQDDTELELVSLVIIVATVVCCSLCVAIVVFVVCRHMRRASSTTGVQRRSRMSSTSTGRASRRRGSNSIGPYRGRPPSQSPSIRRGKQLSTSFDDTRMSAYDRVPPPSGPPSTQPKPGIAPGVVRASAVNGSPQWGYMQARSSSNRISALDSSMAAYHPAALNRVSSAWAAPTGAWPHNGSAVNPTRQADAAPRAIYVPAPSRPGNVGRESSVDTFAKAAAPSGAVSEIVYSALPADDNSNLKS